ncbi:MAG: PorV/PorQ family protein [Ignavibacteriales bacterium]|nr:PorV/PorQ family protein [Ignavibacteriales bacterium]
MKNIFRLLIIVLALLLTLDVYAGGGNRTGTGGAAQLLIPVGPRGIAMGEANLAVAQGIESIFWNPAGVANMQNSTSVMFSHMSYLADIGVEYGAVATNIEGFGVVALSLKSLGIGDILVTTTTDPDGLGGAVFSPQMLTAGLTYSRQLTERISVGLTANLITETLGDASSTGFGFNVGVIYNTLADIKGLSIGIAMKNVGPQMQYDGSGMLVLSSVQDQNRPPQYTKIEAAKFDLPSSFEMGVGYKAEFDEQNAVQLAGVFLNNNFSEDEYKFGAEYGFNNQFFARLGYQFAPDVDSEQYLYGLTAGAGVNVNLDGILLRVDYAYRTAQYFDGNHVFALSVGF